MRVTGKILENQLNEELNRLKKLFNMGHELKVSWNPRDDKISGEVRDGVIYIYVRDYDEAVKTLMHEFIDYVLSRMIEPYMRVANKLIELLNELAYREKEKTVQILVELLDSTFRNSS